MQYEHSVIGNARKCESIHNSIISICKCKKNYEAGLDLYAKNKLTIHRYNLSVDFSGFEDFQWESFFGVNNSFSWRVNSWEFVSYFIAYHYTSRDEKVLDLCRDGLMSWLSRYIDTDEQYPFVYTWHDMGTAMRVEHMITFLAYTYSEANEWLRNNEAFRATLLQACIRHASFLSKDSFYTKNTNHGVYQARCLLLLSVFFDEGKASLKKRVKLFFKKWQREGHQDSLFWHKLAIKRLSSELLFAFTEEGVHVENSPAYHAFVLKFLRVLTKECFNIFPLPVDVESRKKSHSQVHHA